MKIDIFARWNENWNRIGKNIVLLNRDETYITEAETRTENRSKPFFAGTKLWTESKKTFFYRTGKKNIKIRVPDF
jgi:hypothetical protein